MTENASPSKPSPVLQGSAAPALTPPPYARWLGYAGLLPFVGAAAGAWLLQAPGLQAWAGVALLAYGALIATFLGGIHWGLAMRGADPVTTRLLWGVVPSLVAWVALMLPLGAGLLVVAALLATCYAVDRALYASAGLAGWLTLRLQLTAVATASCVAGAWALY
ncbi:DUF3429 domain-containing protein [Polaromonas sp. YR568]|uniref:DUF3429 domain-containing protein n=1 Tax=Polaromonas sp. YR568 TaxID=1855301 RepID=UPI003137FD60